LTEAIGDTLTVIQRPLQNIPALVTSGDTLTIACEADPATTGWAAQLIHLQKTLDLTVTAATYDPTTLWWQLQAVIPPVAVHELYDLRVFAEGGIDDITRNAVQVLAEFKNNYYFIHITDPHLPDHEYHDSGGAVTDSTEMVDLRTIIQDLNVINPEFVLLTGDIINEGELEDYLGWRSYTRAQRLLTEFEVPVFLIAGNHDIGGWDDTPPPDGTARREWWRFFGWKRLENPPPGAPRATQNYSFDYGPVHFVALESYINYDYWRWPVYGATSFTNGQLQWLVVDLASAATSSLAQVMFYHMDFDDQLNLGGLGIELALWGHIHRDEGSLSGPPYDLATNNVSDGERAYRFIRVTGSTLTPRPTLSAGSSGQMFRVQYTPANDGTHDQVTAQIVNNHSERFQNGMLRIRMPLPAGGFEVEGATLLQVDDSGPAAVCYVGVDILPSSTTSVTVTRVITDVAGEGAVPGPVGVDLLPNYPNPFNPTTELRYQLSQSAQVRLAIYDLQGKLVKNVVDQELPAGEHQASWDGKDRTGHAMPSGIYVVRLEAAGRVSTQKIVLAR
jgi:3',5'-cyclic AMP phosphodiesterase CpdA